MPVHILSHQDLRWGGDRREDRERVHVCIQRLKETLCYLSFEDDVECVCFCSFSNDDIFVLVLHLRGDWQKNKAIMTGVLKMYNMYPQILQMG